ncbi:TIGR03943 family putative permease subunit [Clostridium sp.]|uniref:TIGR03943 family putative permease subunit n=1 Tax=Clostridium sp. TaxID=1506 RepID=UPI003F2E6F91
MKKFNIDEFIWLIVLSLLTLFLVYLVGSGNIYRILSMKIVKYMYFAIGLLAMLIIVQIGKVFTFNSRQDNSNKYLPLIFTLIVGAFLSFNTFEKVDYIENAEGKFTLDINNEIIEITNSNYYIINEIKENPDNYLGKKIMFTGFIYDINAEDDLLFTLAREEIQCCAADAVLLGLEAKGYKGIKEGTWIKAIGEIKKGENYTFDIIEYIKVSKPKEEYFNKHLHEE